MNQQTVVEKVEKPLMLRQAQHERFFVAFARSISSSFALSSPRSGRVEGLSIFCLPHSR